MSETISRREAKARGLNFCVIMSLSMGTRSVGHSRPGEALRCRAVLPARAGCRFALLRIGRPKRPLVY